MWWGRRTAKGVRYVTFGCRAHHSRGDAICPNGLTISEKKLNAAVFDALRGILLSPGAVHYFVEAFNRELTNAARKDAERGAR